MKLSHSSISMYNECPKKYWFAYILKVPKVAKSYFSFGTSIHSPLEFMYSGEECPPLDDVLEFYEQKWLSAGYRDADEEEKAKKLGEKLLRAYYEKHAATWVKPLSVEEKFDMTVANVRVTGFIDRIDIEKGGLHVIDYKTGKEINVERIKEDEQLTMYQIAAEETGKGKVKKLSLYHVPTLKLHSSPRHSDELVEKLKTKIVATHSAIMRGEYEPTPSEKACGQCGCKAACPAWL